MDPRAAALEAREWAEAAVSGGADGLIWIVCDLKGWNGAFSGALSVPGLVDAHRQIAEELGARHLPEGFFPSLRGPDVQVPELFPRDVPVPGTNDCGLWFDGTDDCVAIPSLVYDGSHPITLEAVVTPDLASTQSYGPVLGCGEAGGLGLRRRGDRWEASAHDGRTYRDILSANPIQARRTHLALVLDGLRLWLYVDGRREQYVDIARYQANRVPLMIGANPSLFGPTAVAFHGLIEAVRVSRTARYKGNDFTPQLPLQPDAETLACLPLEEGQGDRTADVSGNGHHGYIVGPTWRQRPAP